MLRGADVVDFGGSLGWDWVFYSVLYIKFLLYFAGIDGGMEESDFVAVVKERWKDVLTAADKGF